MGSLVVDFDDMGCTRVISDQCQSRDCRVELDKLHYANPNFKVTLFAIPGEMTAELAEWCKANEQWVQLAVHGFYHRDNYECEKMSYEEFDARIKFFQPMIDIYFTYGFKAPGWQISDDIYRWLKEHDWWLSDKSYNNHRRPKELASYVNYDKNDFRVHIDDKVSDLIPAHHGHVWDVGWNGIQETFDVVESIVKEADDFKFVSEVINENT